MLGLLLAAPSLLAQNVGIGTATPHASAKLQVESSNSGLLIPRVALVAVTNNTTPVAAPATGLIVWNTNAAVTGGNGIGFYCWDGTQWLKLVGSNSALATQDHDFYEVGTTTPPNANTDNIYNMGNVGLGTTTPAHRLDVLNGNTSLDNYLILKDFDDLDEHSRFIARDSAVFVWQGGLVVGQYANGALPAGFNGNGTFLSRSTTALAATGGNVGIGNTTPEVKLDLRGFPLQWSNRSQLGTDQGGNIELGGNNSLAGTGTPYIDFHFNGLTQDYNTRISNSADGQLSFLAPTRSIFSNGVRMAGLPTSILNTTVITRNASGDLETRDLPANVWDGDDNTTYTAGTGLSLTGTTFANTAPDQTVTLTGAGATTISGTYPNFTITSTDNVNDADANPTNELQTISKTGNTVTLSNGGGSFIDDNTTYTAGTGITLTGTAFSSTLGTSIESTEITDGTIAAADLNQMGATTNQVLTWNGTTWTPAAAATDHDWYEVGTSTAPDNINDNKYTFGKIGMGINNPVAHLHVVGVDGLVATGTYGSGLIPATGAGVRMMWYPNKAAFRVGRVFAGQWDDASIGANSFAAGVDNTASGGGSVILGGVDNLASGNFSGIFQGSNNSVTGSTSTIAGGQSNAVLASLAFLGAGRMDTIAATASESFIGAGQSNYTNMRISAIVGGRLNRINTTYTLDTGAFIGSGRQNTITGFGVGHSFIGTGVSNEVTSALCAILTGTDNSTNGNWSFIGTGAYNRISTGTYSFIGSGNSNSIQTSSSFIGTGNGNKIFGSSSFIGAGSSNYSQGVFSFIGTGSQDSVLADRAFIGSGTQNMITATARGGFIGSGWQNKVQGINAVIVGGRNNQVMDADSVGFIGAGRDNTMDGAASVIGGGISNSIINNSYCSNILGGFNNTLTTGSSVIGGGSNNNIAAQTGGNVIGGGIQNYLSGSGYGFIGGGQSDSVTAAYSAVVGGSANANKSTYAFIGGGRQNKIEINSHYSVVGGGQLNSVAANATYGFIGGGSNNSVWNDYSLVVGGTQNMVTTPYSSIVGGQNNRVTQFHAGIFGGQANAVQGRYAFIGMGRSDTIAARGEYGFIGAGWENRLNGYFSVIVGGINNEIESYNVSANLDSVSFIGAGRDNYSYYSNASFIGGGISNETNNAYYSSIVGGFNNTINNGGSNRNMYGFIGGGRNNRVSNTYSAIGGGFNNAITASYAYIGGGQNNTASGTGSFIGAGNSNTATGFNSVALGYYAHAAHNGSFVFSDQSSTVNTATTAINQFVVRASGGTTFYSNSTMTTGVQLAAGGGAWATVSDRRKKEHFAIVDGEGILTKIAALPITSWNYISQSDSIRHLGPMAQDFYAAFGLGESDTTITTTDIDGVTLAATQALEARTRTLQSENAALRQEIADLRHLLQQKTEETTRLQSVEARLERLEALLESR